MLKYVCRYSKNKNDWRKTNVGKPKYLYAEENQDFLDKMCSLLAECGFEMVSAPKDGLQLVDRIQAERPGIVLMDVFLPGLWHWVL